MISPEKVIATNDIDKRKFIGYRVRDSRLIREDRDLFLSALYPESPVRSLPTSFTRLFSYMLLGGFNSKRFLDFYERYLGGYEKYLKLAGGQVFRQEVLMTGNLRVFKHVYKIDLHEFDEFNLDSFRNVHSFKAPYFLTLGTKFMLN